MAFRVSESEYRTETPLIGTFQSQSYVVVLLLVCLHFFEINFTGLAVLMPCLMAQSPAGVQVYLLTSFIFTLFQGAALRNDAFRDTVGLPLMGAPLPEGKFVNEFILYNKLERDTFGVLSPTFQSSFRPYAQMLSPNEMKRMEEEAKEEKSKINSIDGVCVFAPQYLPAYQPSPVSLIVNQIAQSVKVQLEKNKSNDSRRISSDQVTEIAPSPEKVMEAANRGEKPAASIQIMTESNSAKDDRQPRALNTKKLASTKRKITGRKPRRR